MASDHFAYFLTTATNNLSKQKAILKCKTEYRKVLSALNKKIDTLQIKQCGQMWSLIDFKKLTSISVTKQSKALLNLKKTGEKREIAIYSVSYPLHIILCINSPLIAFYQSQKRKNQPNKIF